jgi:cleavage and polyadenylation specificity factor subunit 1
MYFCFNSFVQMTKILFSYLFQFIDNASISSPSPPIYAMLVSREIEGDQSYLNDGLSPEERQIAKDEKEAAMVWKQVEADLGRFDMEQEWVEEIEREDCFTIDQGLGLAPPMPTRKYKLWLVDASSQWEILDKFQLNEFDHGTLKFMFLTDVSLVLCVISSLGHGYA